MPNRMVIQISDTHIVADGLLHDRVDSFANLASIFEQIEGAKERPDAVVLSGDLADHGGAAEYDRLQALVGPFAERLAVPARRLRKQRTHHLRRRKRIGRHAVFRDQRPDGLDILEPLNFFCQIHLCLQSP